MKKNSKKVVKAVETIGNYCNERECDNCIFGRANGCILSLRSPYDFADVAEDLKKLLEV